MENFTSKTITPGSEPSPVAVAELKEWLRLPSEETGHDNLLNGLIAGAVAQIESYCHISLTEKTVELEVAHSGQIMRLPYGPVRAITAVHRTTDFWSDPTPLTTAEYKIGLGAFPGLYIKDTGTHKVSYTVGYVSLPNDLRQAVLILAAFRFNNTGENEGDAGIPDSVLQLIKPFAQVWL